MKKRIVLLDLIRIIFALLIFARHSSSMYGCVWFSNKINSIIYLLTSPIMVCFFVLSGFCIRMASFNRQLNHGKSIMDFYKKRALTVLPTYYLLNILYTCIIDGQIKDACTLLPIQLTAISAPFQSMFGIFVTGGTWFVSCILIAYFIYPLLHQILPQFSGKEKVFMIIILVFLRYYSEKVVSIYGLGTNYSNPFFRCMEFAAGVLLYDLFVCERTVQHKRAALCISSVVVILATVYCLYGKMAAASMLLNNHLTLIPIFACVLFISLNVKCNVLEKSKSLAYSSKLTYQIYLMQMLAWKLSDELFHPQTSIAKVLCSFGITLILSIIAERITWLIQKFFTEKKPEYRKISN